MREYLIKTRRWVKLSSKLYLLNVYNYSGENGSVQSRILLKKKTKKKNKKKPVTCNLDIVHREIESPSCSYRTVPYKVSYAKNCNIEEDKRFLVKAKFNLTPKPAVAGAICFHYNKNIAASFHETPARPFFENSSALKQNCSQRVELSLSSRYHRRTFFVQTIYGCSLPKSIQNLRGHCYS